MRWIYLAIVVVFVAALIIFLFQNTERVRRVLPRRSASRCRSPCSLLVAYVLGALSGGSLYALLQALGRRVAARRA